MQELLSKEKIFSILLHREQENPFESFKMQLSDFLLVSWAEELFNKCCWKIKLQVFHLNQTCYKFWSVTVTVLKLLLIINTNVWVHWLTTGSLFMKSCSQFSACLCKLHHHYSLHLRAHQLGTSFVADKDSFNIHCWLHVLP